MEYYILAMNEVFANLPIVLAKISQVATEILTLK